MQEAMTVWWYVAGDRQPGMAVIDPCEAGVDIPASILEWAEEHGYGTDGPDLVLYVSPADRAPQLYGEVACRKGELPPDDAARVRAVMG